MRLWKVRTWADITIETKNIFGKCKRHQCYFTHHTKFIYAESIDDAKNKYYDLFFHPIEDGYDKTTLSMMEFEANTRSLNMIWHLPFNSKVVHTHEFISVIEHEVKEDIDYIRRHSTANDFRDWLFNGSNNPISLDELDWINK